MSYLPKSKKQPGNLKPKRLIIFGDTHFGVGANDEYFFRSMVMYMRDIFIPWIENNAKSGDVLLFTGDIFDNDTTLRIEVLDAVEAIFEKLAELLPVIIIVGNHDVVRKKSNEINSLRGIGHIDGVYVYYQAAIWDCDYDNRILFYPWKKEIETLDDFIHADGCNILVSHAHFNGLAFDNEYIKKVDGEIKSIDVKDLGMFELVVNGHIHRKQDLLNIMNVGSPWQLTFNDDRNLCGFHILDLKDYSKEFIENTYSPRFYKETIDIILDMTRDVAMSMVKNKLVKISYPAELAKTFSLDIVRRELEGAINVEFLPEYHYTDQGSRIDDTIPEVVDLKKILENVSNTLQLPKNYTESLVDELHEMYTQHSKIESTEL